MTIAYWCVLAAIMTPYIWSIVAKQSAPKFDNSKPREWLGNLDGRGARANWAQQNNFEALPGFIAAVIIAHLAQAPQFWIDLLALNFVVLRVFYGVLYIADKPSLRSLVWMLAIACVVGLFVISA